MAVRARPACGHIPLLAAPCGSGPATGVVGATAPHVPVLVEAVTELLERPDGVVVDVTLGAGGHAAAVVARRLQLWGSADLLGIDRD